MPACPPAKVLCNAIVHRVRAFWRQQTCRKFGVQTCVEPSATRLSAARGHAFHLNCCSAAARSNAVCWISGNASWTLLSS